MKNEVCYTKPVLPDAWRKVKSALIYRGPSPKNGQTILVIATGLGSKGSENTKTGEMAQIFILVEDESPIDAIKSGADIAICGECPLRGPVCYVDVTRMGPKAVWDSYHRGNIPTLSPEAVGAILRMRERASRFGAYGDPAMIPYAILRALLDASGTGHTSYTHQWKEDWFDARVLEFSMGSLDHENTAEELHERFPTSRHYRMTLDYKDIDPETEIMCPHKKEDGSVRVQCVDCGLCSGTDRAAKSIVIKKND